MVSINKFVRGISLLTVVGFLASCSSSDDKSAAKVQEARPQQLTFSNPTPGTPVTRDQVDQIRSVFGQKPAISIPPTDLLLKDEDSKLENSQLNSLRYSEMMLQYTANPETYALYKAMRQNCRKQHGTLNLDFTVPLEKVTSVNDLKTGDHFISTAVGSYGGATCDVESDGKISYSAKVDKLETDGIASGEVTYGLKALMKNAHYAQLLRSKGVIVSSSASGIVSKQNVQTEDPTDADANLNFTVKGSYFTLDSEIPFSTTYKTYAKAVSQDSTEFQIAETMEVKMPSFTVTVDAQIIAVTYKNNARPGITKFQKYFVNGNEMTIAEIKNLIGENLNSDTAQNVTSIFSN